MYTHVHVVRNSITVFHTFTCIYMYMYVFNVHIHVHVHATDYCSTLHYQTAAEHQWKKISFRFLAVGGPRFMLRVHAAGKPACYATLPVCDRGSCKKGRVQ